MGLIEIYNNNKQDQTYYMTFSKKNEKEISIKIFNDIQEYFYVELNSESSDVKMWSKNLKQSPSLYMESLIEALERYGYVDSSEFDSDNSGNKFELDEQHNLVWKHCITSRNIVGKKGKFSLEKMPANPDSFKIIMTHLLQENREREIKLKELQDRQKIILNENKEYQSIAENSVKLKEEFESEIYDKFSSLLNSKKKKLAHLKEELENLKLPGIKEGPSGETSAVAFENLTSDEDDYEIDTDVDSDTDPDDVAVEVKRPPEYLISDNKRIKSNVIGDVIDLTEDSMNESLEAELNLGFAKRDPAR